MPTGGFFGTDSSESGIKQKFNDYATTARKQNQKCLTWLIQQHQISRAHVIELSTHMAAGFEKSISQHISLKNPLRKPEIFERDKDFLVNIQWLLDNWSEIRSTSRTGVVSRDNRTLNETIELFEIAFRRMATATKSYTTYNIKLQSTQIQQAAIELEKIISANLSIATPAFLDLQKMLHEIIISIQPEQFQRVIFLLTSKVAAIMQSQSEADVDKDHLELAKALTQFQEILTSTSISAETNPMLSLIKKLTTIAHQIPQEEMAAYGLYADFTLTWRQDPHERLKDITRDVKIMISSSATDPMTSRLKMLLLQEQSRVQAEILLAEKTAPAAISSADGHSTTAPLQFAYPATSAPIVGSVEQQTHHARSCSSFSDSAYVQFVASATRSAKDKPFTL